MKDKLSKVKNLVKKYGLTGTIKKMTGYIYSNYIVRISMKEKIYVALKSILICLMIGWKSHLLAVCLAAAQFRMAKEYLNMMKIKVP